MLVFSVLMTHSPVSRVFLCVLHTLVQSDWSSWLSLVTHTNILLSPDGISWGQQPSQEPQLCLQ